MTGPESPSPSSELLAVRRIAAIFVLVFVAVLVIMPSAQILTVASITTEKVSFRVVDHAMAAFPVSGVRISDAGTMVDGLCAEGLLQPVNGVIVTYGRTGGGPLEISVDPSGDAGTVAAGAVTAALSKRDGTKASELRGAVYAEADSMCGPLVVPRLPIWGSARFGDEFPRPNGPGRPTPKLLLRGTLKIEARSRFRGVLYTLPEVPIPVASRLEADSACRGDPVCGVSQDSSAIWWGSAALDPASVALQVDAATQAPRLSLYRPLRKDAEQIEVSSLTQLTNDPDLLLGQFLLAGFGLIGTAPTFVRHARDVLDRRRTRRPMP